MKAERPEQEPKGPKLNLTLRLPQALINKADELTSRLSEAGGILGGIGISRGEVLRRAIEVGLDAMAAELEGGRSKRAKAVR